MSNLRLLIITLLVFLTAREAAGQHQLPYRGSVSLGMLMGESSSALQVQTVHGVQYKQWQAGLGIAVDNYRYRTVPLFMEVRRMLPLKTNHLFLYAGGGPNLLWLTSQQKQDIMITNQTKFHAGWYGDLGAGYQLALAGNKNAVSLSAGYSLKTLRTVTQDYSPIAYDAPPVFSERTYTLGRIVVKLGISF
jgi:hypothetical protein